MRAYDTGAQPRDRTAGTLCFYRWRLTQEREVSPAARQIMERAAVGYAESKAGSHPELYGEFMDWLRGPYATSVGGLSI